MSRTRTYKYVSWSVRNPFLHDNSILTDMIYSHLQHCIATYVEHKVKCQKDRGLYNIGSR